MQTSTMEDWKTLKRVHPQKYYLKITCRILYYLGLGDCWYEENHRSNLNKRIYAILAVLANIYLMVDLTDQLLAHLRTDLSPKEHTDLMQFTVAHPTVCSKFIVLYLHKNQIKVVLQRLLEDNREQLKYLDLERSVAKKAIYLCIFYTVNVYITVFCAGIDSVRVNLTEGKPMGSEITYYPTSSDSGFFVNVLRILIELHWWYLVTIMCMIDCVVFCSLKFLGCRFKLVQIYFKNIRKNVLYNQKRKSQAVLKQEYKREFIKGIKLHEGALRSAHNAQHALGKIYSIQTFQSITLTVMCLVKLVSNKRDLTYLVGNMFYIFCMIILTGAYMTISGDITYEAAEVSTAIFESGWELVGADKELQTLAVVAIARSQKPVVMTALGIVPMSYSNFISVLRLAYSFFAVMY